MSPLVLLQTWQIDILHHHHICNTTAEKFSERVYSLHKLYHEFDFLSTYILMCNFKPCKD